MYPSEVDGLYISIWGNNKHPIGSYFPPCSMTLVIELMLQPLTTFQHAQRKLRKMVDGQYAAMQEVQTLSLRTVGSALKLPPHV